MNELMDKLTALRDDLDRVNKDVKNGRLSNAKAADKIIQIRDEIDKTLEELKKQLRK